MRGKSALFLLAAALVTVPATARASSLLLADPGRFLTGVAGAIFAEDVVRFEPVAPKGDTGLDGSAALFEPDDIGFGPEPDGNLVAALGTGGWIELVFANNVRSDGILASDLEPGDFPDGFELLLFEDGELDGAAFYGRLPSMELTLLGSLSDIVLLDPIAPGLGANSRDTVIAIDLDAIFTGTVELISIRIVDDGITEVNGIDSDTFELDAVANLSPGAPTPPVALPEPGSLPLLATSLVALGLRRRLRDAAYGPGAPAASREPSPPLG